MADELNSGWTALAAQPVLRTQLHQHLRAIRTTLREQESAVERPVPVSRLVLLASHAYDTRQRALREGWRPPRVESDWTPEEWTGLRLLACYELASREPKGPRPKRRLTDEDSPSPLGVPPGGRPA
ncbi:hypothetical protein B0I33_109136 [Prauserella shujinwangii]|uniref:Uncharacterized protein n=1 Tax=Prauserella shujinwangii TaxID=1453103 RepID=A0A2T0LQ51_9PSEU|nr:DUF6401 family natural product biosynthesis protein [Prauserella shujinwangii]PRX45473.1 hypothetical protein B0I33_109136 [Prauserella shujinwangii]